MTAQAATSVTNPRPVPARAGIGLRAVHFADVIATRPAVGWLEVHSENHFAAAGPAHEALEAVRADYPISLHGVGLSLGSADGIDVPERDPGVDATLMIKRITPRDALSMGVPIPDTVIPRDDTTFYGVPPGTLVSFDVTFQNDIVMPALTAQVFLAQIIVVGNGVADLDDREVVIVVPAGSGPLF